jgi:hypothetical protein
LAGDNTKIIKIKSKSKSLNSLNSKSKDKSKEVLRGEVSPSLQRKTGKPVFLFRYPLCGGYPPPQRPQISTQ